MLERVKRTYNIAYVCQAHLDVFYVDEELLKPSFSISDKAYSNYKV